VDIRVAIGSFVKRKIPKQNMPRRTCSAPLAFPPTHPVSTHSALLFSRVVACIFVLVALGAGVLSAEAQESDDPLRFASWLVSDSRAIPGSLIRPPSAMFGAGLLGVGLVSYRDAQWAGSLQQWHRREAWRIVEEFGDANAMRPAAILVFVGSLFQEDRRFQDAAFTGLESLMMANLLTNALKAVTGRSRPWQEPGADDWELLSGKTSFPSGHATTAFALMTPWIMYFDHPLAWVGMGVAAASSLSRVTLRYHWPSDVLAGALIGSSVSIWLSRRHQKDTRSMNTMARGTFEGNELQERGKRVQSMPVVGLRHVGLRLTF